MDSKVYKILAAITIALGVIFGLIFATVTIPAIEGFTRATTTFNWSTFILFSFIGFIGGMLLLGVGNITEDLATLDTIQQQHVIKLQNAIEKGNGTSNSASQVRQSSASASSVSGDNSKLKSCLSCGKPLPPNTGTMMCRECLSK